MIVSDLFNDIDFLCGSTSASYPTASKIRNINIAYSDVCRLIWDSDGGWQYDDSNASTLPIARTTIVNNQADYQLPSNAQKIHQVTVKDNTGTEWKLKPYDPSQEPSGPLETFDSPGLPTHYDLIGRSVILYPTPSTAYTGTTSALCVYTSRDITKLSATSATPGIPEGFHRILSYAAAIDFVQDEQTRKNYTFSKARLENGLTKFYAHRAPEVKTAITPSSQRRWQQYR